MLLKKIQDANLAAGTKKAVIKVLFNAVCANITLISNNQLQIAIATENNTEKMLTADLLVGADGINSCERLSCVYHVSALTILNIQQFIT